MNYIKFFYILVAIFIRRIFSCSASVFCLKPDNPDNTHKIILIHGLGRTALSMFYAASYFQKCGWTVYLYDYRSTKKNIDVHAEEFASFISKSGIDGNIFFLTHSLGGIILRAAAVKFAKKLHIQRAVMLAPPNRGSHAIQFYLRIPFLSKILRPLQELKNTDDSYVNKLPEPEFEHGIIAGIKDKKVSTQETMTSSMKDFLIVNCGHTFIMNNKNVIEASVSFFKSGRFK